MAKTIGRDYEPTDFDRMAGTIAFQRMPGNRSPDQDPESARIGSLAAGSHWARPVRLDRPPAW